VASRAKAEGNNEAAVDPGEVHAMVISDGDDHLIINGRGLRSVQRQRNRSLNKFQKKLCKLQKGSRRWEMINTEKRKFLARNERRLKHLIDAITAHAVRWCMDHNVTTVYYGRPKGISQNGGAGRHHNQRMSQWPYYKTYQRFKAKAKLYGIEVVDQDEKNTTRTCPACGRENRADGRNYSCKSCGSTGHRDVVGATNILSKGQSVKIEKGRRLPKKENTTYLRQPDQVAAGLQ
jgi:putative transposase